MSRVLTAVMCAALHALAAAQEPVRAPHYGEVLFHHYQGRWAAALGSLAASQQLARLAPHDAEAELLRGGLLLDWGQHDEAEAVFERVADQHPLHHDRAWTALARLRWQLGRVGDAEAALARVRAPLQPASREAERALLLSLVHLERGRAADAVQVLQPLVQPGNGLPVARFNHAIALLRAGQADAARAALDALGRLLAGDDEQRNLRDRANLALAELQLRDGAFAPARSALERVRLHGPAAHAALHADGWAALQQGRAGDAVVAFDELARRDADDDHVLEARLALPRAHAEAGAQAQALALAQALLQRIADEQRTLQQARQAVADGSALAPLLDRLGTHEPGDDAAAVAPAGDHAALLRPVWAEHAFQTALARWADLRWAGRHLGRRARDLVAFEDMRMLRLEGFQARLPDVLRAASDDRQGLVAQRRTRDALADALQQADADDSGDTLADATEGRQRQLLARMQSDLTALGDDPGAAALAERLRRVQGALTWQLVQARPARLRQVQLAWRDLDRHLAAAEAGADALQRESRVEPQRLNALGERLQRAARQLAALQPRLMALADEQRLALQGLALAALQQREQRLARHALQAELLHAQLQDGTLAALHGPGPHDAPR
ncbi:MAG: tetratricopeptide repeat protein [Rubrivivax sp.]